MPVSIFCAADGDALEPGVGFFGLGEDAGDFGQRIVHQAALVGIQPLHEQGLAGFEHPLGAGAGAAQQLGLCPGAVVVAIDPHAGGFLPLGLHQAVDHVLQVIEAVTFIADEEAGIRAVDEQGNAIFIRLGAQGTGKAQRVEQGAGGFAGEGGEAVGGFRHGDANGGGGKEIAGLIHRGRKGAAA